MTPTPDQAAAHDFLCELRTRIATQALPYQYGVDTRALESLWEIFGHARAAMKKYPGCNEFAAAVTEMLNRDLRPVTAKWHRAYEEGRLNSRDGGDDFRTDLADLQIKLRAFRKELEKLAYGSALDEVQIPPVMGEEDLEPCLSSIRFGVVDSDPVWREINEGEAAEVRARRALYEIQTAEGTDAVGLALSGGGVRSATFSLGVVQVLAKRGLLKDVDFLSTVSGGGYIGSFLTVRLGTGATQSDIGCPAGPDSETIRYLRHHAKYLAASSLKHRWSMVTATLAGLLLNWSAPAFLVMVAALAWIGVESAVPGDRKWSILFSVSGVLTFLSLLLYGVLIRCGRYAAKIGGVALAVLLAATSLLGIAWLISAGYKSLPDWTISSWTVTGGLAGLVAAGPAILRFIPVLKSPVVRKIVLQVLLLLAGIILPLMALTLFYLCLYLAGFGGSATDRPPGSADGILLLLCIAAVSGFVAIFILNINLTAPHRLYRDQLARTFVQISEMDDRPIPLNGINANHQAPYQLINAALNLPSSREPRLRDRRCDFFVFSKLWCGSVLTGYFPTPRWQTNKSPPDLATAVAISGAAASSHMGLGSKPTLTALLTFLNVRLGFWIRHPGRKSRWSAPRFLCLLREMTGIGMSEKRAWLNLSDGGHIENMAVYELLRRRCKYIICVDGEADPEFTFRGLMTLVRHAQIDFGIRISPALDRVRPDRETRYSPAHGTLYRLYYPSRPGSGDSEMGLLLYLKLSVTGNESELIRRYRGSHPDFPHQSTLDQFFDEEQFEAYRQLGVHVADGFFSRPLMSSQPNPTSMAVWFRRLAENLLEPERN